MSAAAAIRRRRAAGKPRCDRCGEPAAQDYCMARRLTPALGRADDAARPAVQGLPRRRQSGPFRKAASRERLTGLRPQGCGGEHDAARMNGKW
jgi:hypothetical protein